MSDCNMEQKWMVGSKVQQKIQNTRDIWGLNLTFGRKARDDADKAHSME